MSSHGYYYTYSVTQDWQIYWFQRLIVIWILFWDLWNKNQHINNRNLHSLPTRNMPHWWFNRLQLCQVGITKLTISQWYFWGYCLSWFLLLVDRSKDLCFTFYIFFMEGTSQGLEVKILMNRGGSKWGKWKSIDSSVFVSCIRFWLSMMATCVFHDSTINLASHVDTIL